MTRVVIIEPESPRKCELCLKVAECRPYGPGGKQICFACGMKDRKATEAAFRMSVLGEVKGNA